MVSSSWSGRVGGSESDPSQALSVGGVAHRHALEPADRVLLAALSRILPRARWNTFTVTPATSNVPTVPSTRPGGRTSDWAAIMQRRPPRHGGSVKSARRSRTSRGSQASRLSPARMNFSVRRRADVFARRHPARRGACRRLAVPMPRRASIRRLPGGTKLAGGPAAPGARGRPGSAAVTVARWARLRRWRSNRSCSRGGPSAAGAACGVRLRLGGRRRYGSRPTRG
jgi:hypothetical protein